MGSPVILAVPFPVELLLLGFDVRDGLEYSLFRFVVLNRSKFLQNPVLIPLKVRYEGISHLKSLFRGKRRTRICTRISFAGPERIAMKISPHRTPAFRRQTGSSGKGWQA
jgi:hypothetical protein